MKTQSFEEFLREWHMRDYHGTDDNAPDAFDQWLAEADVHLLIDLADLAIREAEIRGIKRGGDIALEALTTSLRASSATAAEAAD